MSDMDHEVRSARMLGCEISTNPLDPLEPILKMCEYHHPDEDMSILARAYRRAVNQHSSQRRDRKSTRLNSSHWNKSRMPSSA